MCDCFALIRGLVERYELVCNFLSIIIILGGALQWSFQVSGSQQFDSKSSFMPT